MLNMFNLVYQLMLKYRLEILAINILILLLSINNEIGASGWKFILDSLQSVFFPPTTPQTIIRSVSDVAITQDAVSGYVERADGTREPIKMLR